jgi:hypothetical protein
VANENFNNAKNAKNDEFYTQFHDIEKEINAYLDFNPDVFKNKSILLPCDDPEWSNFTKYFAQNFEKLGISKLVSTSFAPNSKAVATGSQPTLFELESPQFDETKTASNGKIFTLHRDNTGDEVINVEDLEWKYLEGDGDFRSAEIRKLRDDADIIFTNPPFSQFRDFLTWISEADKQFLLIGNLNAITYKEVFPHIQENKMWLGATGFSNDMVFRVPNGTLVTEQDREKAARMGYVGDFTRLGNSCWFTNLDHGRRHKSLPLMSQADNKKFSKHKEIKGIGYKQYDNYLAMEVPFIDAIPSDYGGVMGVPVSYLDKYNPDQFELIGLSGNTSMPDELKIPTSEKHDRPYLEGRRMYVRLFIKTRGEKE